MTSRESLNLPKLTAAITSKNLIKFSYKDTTSNFDGIRTVEPHLVGLTKFKNPEIWLSGWFIPTNEQKANGHSEGWKNYIVDIMQQLEVLPEKYSTVRPGYNPKDKNMSKVMCATKR